MFRAKLRFFPDFTKYAKNIFGFFTFVAVAAEHKVNP